MEKDEMTPKRREMMNIMMDMGTPDEEYFYRTL